MHKILYKLNRLKYYFKVLAWAKKHSKQVDNYGFLLELKNKCHKNYLKAERSENLERMNKAKIQKELINKILNYIKL